MCVHCGTEGADDPQAIQAQEQNLAIARINWPGFKEGAQDWDPDGSPEKRLAGLVQRTLFLIATGELDLPTFVTTVIFGVLEEQMPQAELPPLVTTDERG